MICRQIASRLSSMSCTMPPKYTRGQLQGRDMPSWRQISCAMLNVMAFSGMPLGGNALDSPCPSTSMEQLDMAAWHVPVMPPGIDAMPFGRHSHGRGKARSAAAPVSCNTRHAAVTFQCRPMTCHLGGRSHVPCRTLWHSVACHWAAMH